jgi:hypothetical protein
MSKPACIHVAQLDWAQPEYSDNPEALGAQVNGLEFEVAPSPDQAKKFDWLVRVTAELSETPEVIDLGTASSVSGAQRGCGNAANTYQRARAKNRPTVKIDPVVDPKEMQAENAVEKVEQALGAQMLDARAKMAEPVVAKKRSRKPKAEQPEAVAA